jgi:hypothetical protein
MICRHFGWFIAVPFDILNGQDVYMTCLDCLVYFTDPSYILNGQDVYMSCLDGLVQTHFIS